MPSCKKFDILLVEDEADLLEEIGSELIINGFNIVVAQTSADAIAKSRNQRFDCIVVDFRLHRGSGEEVIQSIRLDVRGPNLKTPIIIASAYVSRNSLSQIKGMFQNILTKPYSIKRLITSIEELIAKSTKKNDPKILNKSILYVEDEKELAQEIIEELKDAGVDVVHVTSADAAFLQTKSKKFDCLIVDINLAIGRGDELIERLRSDYLNENKDVPIIVASSQISKPLLTKLSNKVQGGVVKPYSIRDLFSKLKPYL